MKRIACLFLVCATIGVSLFAEEPKSPAPTLPTLVPMPVGMKPATSTVMSLQPNLVSKSSELPATTQFLVHVSLIKVPTGFRKAFQSIESGSNEQPLVLSDREMNLILTTLAATKSCETLSRPQLLLANGQNGFVQVGQEFPVLGPVTLAKSNGETVYEAKPVMVPAGFDMNIIATEVNAKEFSLKVNLKNVDISSSIMPVSAVESKTGPMEMPLAVAVDWQNRSIDLNIASLVKRSTIVIQHTLNLNDGQAVMLSGTSENRDQELIAILQMKRVGSTPQK
jgi:Flp pilus assembly secretin CpaC